MELLAEMLNYAEQTLAAVILVFLRIGAMMALLPAFGEQAVPARVKLAATVAFTMLVAPAVIALFEAPLSEKPLVSLAGAEVVAGLALGILFRLFIVTLQIAGTIAGQATSLAQIFGAGLGAEPQPAFSTLLVVAGLCLAAMSGLHVHIVTSMISSYQVFLPGQPLVSSDLGEWGVSKVAASFTLGFSLAGPFILVSVLYNLGLGIINRAMPQLMVAFVGAPAISFGSLFLLMLSAPFILTIWFNAFLDGTSIFGGAF